MDLILFIIGILMGAISSVWIVVSLFRRNLNKRALIALLASVALMITGLFIPTGSNDVAEESDAIEVAEEELDEVSEEEHEEKTEEEDEEATEDNLEEESKEPEVTWDDVKEDIIGVSDKDFKEVTEREPTSVLNDTTGNWKKSVISKGIDVKDYALSYYKTNMRKGEVHFIVDFGRNTTTSIKEMGGLIYLDIMEYQEKEELDANKLGSGMLLQSYIIYPDGDIEQLDVN